MNLQDKSDLTGQYRNTIKFLSHPICGIAYTAMPGSKAKLGPVELEVNHSREERAYPVPFRDS